MDLVECKTENRNSQSEHGQPMEQSNSMFCTCDSGMARFQSQHKFQFWRMNSMFEAWASELGRCQSNVCHSRGYERLQKSKDSLKACFENVKIRS